MRSCLIVLVCLLALTGGALLALLVTEHPQELARAWSAGSALYGTAAALPPASDANSVAPAGGWTPPKNIPAHANWSWHMSDGKTYDDVVITQISPRDVTISHSLGIAHLPLDSLPADVQRELGYTPSPASVPAASH